MQNLPTLNISKTSSVENSDKVKEIMDFLNEHYYIRINCFDTSKSIIKIKNKKLKYPPDINYISLHLQSLGITHNDTLLRKILTSPNHIETYNPIEEYFEDLKGKHKKGKSHIDKLCTFFIARNFNDKDEQYYQNRLSYLIKKWLVATAATSLGLYNNPVALGIIHPEEGIGKTFFFDFIVPEKLKDFYVQYNPKKMEMPEIFAKRMIILYDELVGINNRTADLFKNSIQRETIEIKHPRDPFPETVTRIGSAAFTHNRNAEIGGFLSVNMGYRRFCCIEIEEIKQEYSKQIDVNKIWAEAFALIGTDFDYIFNISDWKEFKEYNARYVIETPSLKLIKMYYKHPVNGEGNWQQPTEIMHDMVKAKRIRSEYVDKISAETIGGALTQLKFEKKIKRMPPDNIPKYVYRVHNI